jgi:hypothetical protein
VTTALPAEVVIVVMNILPLVPDVYALKFRSLEQFVEFSFFEPDSTTLGAVVNNDTQSFGHQQIDITCRALHMIPPQYDWAFEAVSPLESTSSHRGKI